MTGMWRPDWATRGPLLAGRARIATAETDPKRTFGIHDSRHCALVDTRSAPRNGAAGDQRSVHLSSSSATFAGAVIIASCPVASSAYRHDVSRCRRSANCPNGPTAGSLQ